MKHSVYHIFFLNHFFISIQCTFTDSNRIFLIDGKKTLSQSPQVLFISFFYISSCTIFLSLKEMGVSKGKMMNFRSENKKRQFNHFFLTMQYHQNGK